MIKRDGRGHSYCAARGEILGPAQDGPERKHLPRMFSLIKNESRRFEDDRDTVVVPTINDADWRCGGVIPMTRRRSFRETKVFGFRGYSVAKLKLKGMTEGRTRAKAFAKNVFINQERKSEVRRRSDTVVVPTINDADWRCGGVIPMTRRAASGKPKSLGSGGSMVAKLKLKGIDGRAPPGVEPAA
ncbi:TPA: hypothetical protein BOS_23187 [Bos taurus]|nr:TPA: hypothetical protein BOS_23187 [Bos taurus]